MTEAIQCIRKSKKQPNRQTIRSSPVKKGIICTPEDVITTLANLEEKGLIENRGVEPEESYWLTEDSVHTNPSEASAESAIEKVSEKTSTRKRANRSVEMKNASQPKDLPSCSNKDSFESDLAPYKFTVKSPTKPTSGGNNSVSELAKGLVELNLMLQKERECSRSLLEENFVLKRQIERMEAGCNCNDEREQSNLRVNKETTASAYSIPATPIVYESIEIERPVVQADAKRENRRSRRINKQKQNAEPKITQQQDSNQAQNSKMIQVPDSEQGINTSPVAVDDGKQNIPENTTKQVATSGPPNNYNSSTSVSNAAPESTHLVRKRLTTEI